MKIKFFKKNNKEIKLIKILITVFVLILACFVFGPKQASTDSGFPVSGTLTSSVFNTANSSSIGYNSIMWKGTLGTEGKVRFQFASSDSSTGPWNFYGGSTCSSGDWFDPLGSDLPIEIKEGSGCLGAWNNNRYFKYKVQLCSKDCVEAGTSTPIVDSVIVNWSL